MAAISEAEGGIELLKHPGHLTAMCLSVSGGMLIISGSSLAGSSPPHGQIVYSARVRQEEYSSDGGRYDLFLKTVPSGNITRLTNNLADARHNLGGAIRKPLFSPDGKRVLFLADYANSPSEVRKTMTGAAPYLYTLLNIWSTDVRTHATTPITKGELGWHDVRWSPDGRYFCSIYPSRAGVIDEDLPIPDDIYVWSTHTRWGAYMLISGRVVTSDPTRPRRIKPIINLPQNEPHMQTGQYILMTYDAKSPYSGSRKKLALLKLEGMDDGIRRSLGAYTLHSGQENIRAKRAHSIAQPRIGIRHTGSFIRNVAWAQGQLMNPSGTFTNWSNAATDEDGSNPAKGAIVNWFETSPYTAEDNIRIIIPSP